MLTTRAVAEGEWGAWSGTEADLAALVRAIESACKRDLEQQIASVDVQGAEGPEGGGRGLQTSEQPADEVRIAPARPKWSVEATIRQKAYKAEVSGALDEVLSQVNLKRAHTIRLRVPADGKPVVEIELHQINGVTLMIAGSDEHAVAGIEGTVVAELRKGVPFWHPIRKLDMVTVWSGAFLAWPLWNLVQMENESSAVDFLAVTWRSLALGMTVLIFSRRVVPGMEILAPGEKPRVTALVKAIATVALSLMGVWFSRG